MRALITVLVLASARSAAAQVPDASETAPAARVAVATEITATFGSRDPGFFNYATYDYSPLRNVRVVVDTALRVTRRVDVLAQLRTDNLSHAQVTGLYVRLRPWNSRRLALNVGRIPPTFGLFGPVGYGAGNPLIGRPLAYGYLTSLRRDALPATTADLIRMRGRGWLTSLPLGNLEAARGLPIMDTERWDSGVQARVSAGPVDWTTAVTLGSLGSPRVRDDNGGRGVATRVVVRPHPAVAIGASGARGAYLTRTVEAALPAGTVVDRFQQRAAGLDLDLSAGRWQLRGEAIRAWWSVPSALDPALGPALTSVAVWGEGRVRVAAGVDATVRLEHLGFGDIATVAGPTPWEAPVSRIEYGVSAAVHRHVRAKVSWQHNRRPLGGRIHSDSIAAGQLSVWF